MARRDPHFAIVGPALLVDLTRGGNWALLLCRLDPPADALGACGYGDWIRTWRGLLEGVACIDHPGFWGTSARFSSLDVELGRGTHPAARMIVNSYLDVFGADADDCFVAVADRREPLEQVAATIARFLDGPQAMEAALDVAEEEGILP